MDLGRGGAYDRKLETLVVARLRAGHLPEALLDELRTRLDEAEADALLSRAEARVAPHSQGPLANRVMIGLAYAWTVALILQNISILTSLRGLSPGYGLQPLLPVLLYFPLLKIGLLCAGMLAFKLRRSVITAALYSLAVLYAFPFGLLLERRIWKTADLHPEIDLLSTSSVFSCAAVVLICVVYWSERGARRTRPTVETFD